MKIDSITMRSFLNSHKCYECNNMDLDSLVLRFQQTKGSAEYATICQKVLGVILKYARGSFINLGLSEDDIYSECMEALLRALTLWKADQKVKFLTYFYGFVHNAIYTLQNRKCNRKYKNLVSLDRMFEDSEEGYTIFEFCEQNKIKPKYKKETKKDSMYNLAFLSKEEKENLAFSLGLSFDDLNSLIVKIRKKLKLTTEEDDIILKDKMKKALKVKNYLKNLC